MPISKDLSPDGLASAGDIVSNMKDEILSVLGMNPDRFGVDYRFHCAADRARWEVRTMTLEQSLSEPYRLELQITTDASHGPPSAMLGQPCCLELARLEHKHFVQGIVESVSHGGSQHAKPVWSLVIRPAFAALGARTASRVFQAMTVPQVVEKVVGPTLERYRRSLRFDLFRSRYPVREYIVQYEETDLSFVQRLLAEEGIWYAFEFPQDEGEAEVVVFSDSQQDLEEIDSHERPIEIDLDAAGGHDHEIITSFVETLSTTVAGHLLIRYDWTNPTVPAESAAPLAAGASPEQLIYLHENASLHEYQAAQRKYTKTDVADQARLRNERAQVEGGQYQGKSNVLGFVPGRRVKIARHPQGLDGDYVVTGVKHQGTYLRDGEGSNQGDYHNDFRCIPIGTPFRPERRAKPRVASIQTAFVVGPDSKAEIPDGGQGDAIHVDEHGRIQVRFVWDRADPESEEGRVQCWLRCAQVWSGSGWGMQFIPRIGMEVVVTFVNGDPDRPLVTGCVYNGLSDLPYPLPENKNRSTILTRSNPGGRGSNELRFDDTKGAEEIYVHAQHDYNEVVEHDHSTTVRGSQTNSVDGSQTESIGGDQAATVKQKRTHTVHGVETLQVVDGSDRLVEVSGNETKRVSKSRTLEVTQQTQETYSGGRKTTVKAADVLEVADGAHKNDHVTGQYNITADEHFKVKQGGDQLYIKEQFYVESGGDVQLKNGGFHLQAKKDGTTTISVGSELTIKVGNASLKMKSDGTVEVSGPMGVKLVAQGGAVEATPQGATVSGLKATLTGTSLAEVTGAIVKIN